MTDSLDDETFRALYDAYVHGKVAADMYAEGKTSDEDGFPEAMRDLKRATDIVSAIHERRLSSPT